MLNISNYSEEELILLNPAYVGFILYSSIRDYQEINTEGMNCALPFILVPMSLNRTIADTLPMSTKTPIGSWMASNEGMMSIFYDQAEAYFPIITSSMRYLLNRNLITIEENGNFLIRNNTLPKNPSFFKQSADMQSALRSSRFLGKWFSHAPSVETIYAQLGVRP